MPKKMTLICLKYFLENISSLSHHIMKEKGEKQNSTPSHTTKEMFFGKQKKPQPSYLEKTTKLLLPMPPKNTTLYNSFHPKK
jgi:hypothetical protein